MSVGVRSSQNVLVSWLCLGINITYYQGVCYERLLRFIAVQECRLNLTSGDTGDNMVSS